MLIQPSPFWKKGKDFMWPLDSDHASATCWFHTLTNLKVLRSLSTMQNGVEWIHVSLSRWDAIPTWMDIKKVKNEFLGKDEEACMTFPKQKDYVNLHQHCLHLWMLNDPRDDRNFDLPNLVNLKSEDAI